MKIIEFKKIKSQIAFTLVLIFVLSSVQGCSSKSKESSETTATSTDVTISAEPTYAPLDIRAGVNTSGLAYPFYVAKETGIFEKYNLNVTIDSYASGGETIDALSLKTEDIAVGADYAVAIRLVEGSSLRVISNFAYADNAQSQLYVTDESIKTPSDLTGKRIGVKKGTVNEYTWAKLFENFNVDPSTVKEVNLSSDAELITAFANEDIDALWVSDVFLPNLKEVVKNPIGIGDINISGTKNKSYLLIDNTFIESNKEGSERFLKAFGEAVDYLGSNPEDAAKIIASSMTIDYDTALGDIKNYIYDAAFTQEGYDYLKEVADWAIKNGVTATSYDIADYVDLGLINDVFPDKESAQK